MRAPLAFMLLLATGTGCATLTATKSEVLSVTSEPTGAEVTSDGVPVGRTPVEVEVPRARAPRIEVSKAGYETERCRLSQGPGSAYLTADIVLCVLLFPFGCAAFVDSGGAWNQLDSYQCHATLQLQGPAPDALRVPSGMAL